MSSILCPNCKKPIAVEEVLRRDMEEKFKKETEQVLKEEKEKILKETFQKSQKEFEILKEEMRLKEQKLREAEESEIALRKEKLGLEEEKRSFELEKQRQIDEERKKIREKTSQEESEKFHLKEKEYSEQIESLKKLLEDAQRKASQGSQQLQGEVQELDLEETLKLAFPTDLIEPVEKGIRGADLCHTVKTPLGNTCGIILWESKRTKAWSDEWITKLKDDVRNSKANVPVIISSVLPKEITSFGLKDGVWVTKYDLALPLATLLRKGLTDVARERYLAQNRGTKAEDIYTYIISDEFRQQIESIVEAYSSMQKQILDEKKAFERIWKIREAQVSRILTSTARIVGSIQGTSGTVLPIKGLDLLSLEEAK